MEFQDPNPFFGRVSLPQIRQALFQQLQRQYNNNLQTISLHPLFMYQYHRNQFLALQAMLNAMTLHYDLPCRGEYPEAYQEIVRDLQPLNLPAACVVWLTTSGWRWHHQVGKENTPKDLSYGAVLRFPEPVSIAAIYTVSSGHRQEIEDRYLLPEDLETAEAFALEQAKSMDKDFECHKYKARWSL
jgi:hypothetical protein